MTKDIHVDYIQFSTKMYQIDDIPAIIIIEQFSTTYIHLFRISMFNNSEQISTKFIVDHILDNVRYVNALLGYRMLRNVICPPQAPPANEQGL